MLQELSFGSFCRNNTLRQNISIYDQTQHGDTLVLLMINRQMKERFWGIKCRRAFCLHVAQRPLMLQNLWLNLTSSSVQRHMLLTVLTSEHRRVRTPFFLKNRLCPWLHIEHIFRSFPFFPQLVARLKHKRALSCSLLSWLLKMYLFFFFFPFSFWDVLYLWRESDVGPNGEWKKYVQLI